ncbi:hypothetical protein B484DRAFT_421485, partial [Ochromonadaceae sp. CCMP2298]
MEEEGDAKDSSGTTRALSAYHHYSKVNSSIVKDELIKEGKDTALGVVVSVVSAKWKTLSTEERSKYEQMAAEDKERYSKECALRDQEVLAQQEERRKLHAVGEETETRMRGTTVKYTDASQIKADAPKKKREMSDKEREKLDSRKQAKVSEENLIQGQMDNLKAERAVQAEA